jgi:hypothetical protein
MDAFKIPPSKAVGDLKKQLEAAIDRGEIEPRREDAYYVAWLARSSLVPGLSPDDARRIAAAGGLPDGAPDPTDPEREPDDHDGDPDRPREGALDCASDPEHTHDH